MDAGAVQMLGTTDHFWMMRRPDTVLGVRKVAYRSRSRSPQSILRNPLWQATKGC